MHRLPSRAFVSIQRPLYRIDSLPPTSATSRTVQDCPNTTLHWRKQMSLPARVTTAIMDGDLNNTSAMRKVQKIGVDPEFSYRSLALPEDEDDELVRKQYRPFLLTPEISARDWISRLELSTAIKMSAENIGNTGERLRILVLYGSLRHRSYSRLLAFEASRILFRLGCDVRIFDPAGLPMKDDVQHNDPKVQELRDLSRWSDGHVWVSAEQHGNLTAVFKNQIDWIPLSVGSVRPTQGRTLAIAQVSGGSQSFNAVNSLRILGRWMRMFVIPNQSSVPKAYTQFTDETPVDPMEGGSRMKESANRARIVDCMEEFVKYTILMKPHFALLGDRYSEREEREEKKAAEKEKQEVESNIDRSADKQGVNGIEIGKI